MSRRNLPQFFKIEKLEVFLSNCTPFFSKSQTVKFNLLLKYILQHPIQFKFTNRYYCWLTSSYAGHVNFSNTTWESVLLFQRATTALKFCACFFGCPLGVCPVKIRNQWHGCEEINLFLNFMFTDNKAIWIFTAKRKKLAVGAWQVPGRVLWSVFIENVLHPPPPPNPPAPLRLPSQP